MSNDTKERDDLELKAQTARQLVEAIEHHAKCSIENPMMENQIKHAEAVGILAHALEVVTY
jgi:hypothetical protein